MPTETFFNLPQEKRARLVSAIRDELTRVSFNDVSINRIIHAAGIPRGSYYQYFIDRDDLYDFLLTEYRARMQESAVRTLREQNGDVFSTVLSGFDESVAFALDEANLLIIRHLFDYRSPAKPTDGKDPFSNMTILTSNINLIDASSLNCSGHEELLATLEILFSLLAFTLAELFCNPQNATALRTRLILKLEILKRGMLRSEGNGGVRTC